MTSQVSLFTLPEVIDPPRKCIVIEIPDDFYHIAAFWKAFGELIFWFNWQRDDLHQGTQAAEIWRQIYMKTLDNYLKNGLACVPETDDIATIEEFMTQIRKSPTDECIIQMLCEPTGVWENWYDPRGCIVSEAAQKPPAGVLAAGECKEFDLVLSGDGIALLPVPVSGGYTIEISDAAGGWWDGVAGHAWNCPQGVVYAAGLCLGAGFTTGGSPIPAQPVGRLIANIGGTYYDAWNQKINIPSGVASTDVYFQMNDATLAGNKGSIALHAKVCNAGTQYQLFSMNTTVTSQATSFNSVAGASYQLRIVGDVCHNAGIPAQRHDALKTSNDAWATNLGRVIFGAGPLYYGVLMDGFNLPDQPYNAAHDYTWVIAGTGAPFVFKPVVNSPYASCGGTGFTVTITKL